MKFISEKEKLDTLVNYYTSSGQLVHVEGRQDNGFHLLLTNLNQLVFDLGDSHGLKIESVHTFDIGENNPEGIAFVVKKFQDQGSNIAAYTSFQETFWIPPESNLGCTLATQGREDLTSLHLGETSAIYDLTTLIPHKKQVIHGNNVNFTWVEKIFGVKIRSSKNVTAGERLIDLFERLYTGNYYKCMLLVGERGRAYATIAERLHLPWTCTRPEGANFPANWIPFETQSEYVTENQKPKIHYVDPVFLEQFRDNRVIIFDDLMASRKTARSFIDLVMKYNMVPTVGTVLDLAYIPPKERVQLRGPVFAPFVENDPGKVEYSPKMKERIY